MGVAVETEPERLLRLSERWLTEQHCEVCSCVTPDFEHDRERKCYTCGRWVSFEDEADLLDWIDAGKTPEGRGAR